MHLGHATIPKLYTSMEFECQSAYNTGMWALRIIRIHSWSFGHCALQINGTYGRRRIFKGDLHSHSYSAVRGVLKGNAVEPLVQKGVAQRSAPSILLAEAEWPRKGVQRSEGEGIPGWHEGEPNSTQR